MFFYFTSLKKWKSIYYSMDLNVPCMFIFKSINKRRCPFKLHKYKLEYSRIQNNCSKQWASVCYIIWQYVVLYDSMLYYMTVCCIIWQYVVFYNSMLYHMRVCCIYTIILCCPCYMPKYVPRLEGIMHSECLWWFYTLNVFGDSKKLNLSKMYW